MSIEQQTGPCVVDLYITTCMHACHESVHLHYIKLKCIGYCLILFYLVLFLHVQHDAEMTQGGGTGNTAELDSLSVEESMEHPDKSPTHEKIRQRKPATVNPIKVGNAVWKHVFIYMCFSLPNVSDNALFNTCRSSSTDCHVRSSRERILVQRL